MVLKKIIPLLVSVMLFLFCGDKSPTETGTGTVDLGKIQGTWQVVKIIDIENSKSKEVPMHNINMFFEIYASHMTVWDYSFWGGSDCIENDTIAYVLEDNRLVGDDFQGDMIIGGKHYTWNTTVTIDGDNLVISENISINNGGEMKTRGESWVLQRYNGVVPPEDWPDVYCEYDQLAKMKVAKSGGILSRLRK